MPASLAILSRFGSFAPEAVAVAGLIDVANAATDPHPAAVLTAWASLSEAVKLGIAAISKATPAAPPAQ